MEGKQIIMNLPLLPLRDLIIYPHMMYPLFVGREKSVAALEHAAQNQSDLVLVAQKDARINNPTFSDLFEVGTLGNIVQLLKLPDGTVKVLMEGKKRIKIVKPIQMDPFLMAEVEILSESWTSSLEVQAIIRSVKNSFESYVKLNKRIPPEILMRITGIEDPGELADVIAAQLNLKLEDKQKILEMIDPVQRLEHVLNLIAGEMEILEIERKIRNRVKKQVEKTQREYYLNEQMQAIQKELGEKDEFQQELQELENRLKNKAMPDEAKEKVRREIKKLRMMPPMSAEATVVRNYIDWVLSLPWLEDAPERKDIHYAQKVLDEDHWGLEKVKERVIEYLSVLALKNDLKGPILCLVGPPGVGKTSLARSIARALNRPFVRISLGGVRDEAEIRGHRRTYVGAMPGKIIQGMRRAEKGNPVMLLDEIDKLASDFRGDPASALLEVLDPEQNHSFQDHYIELDYDLSRVMFIATANTIYTIPKPLLDRLELIHLEGYTETEKFHIAKQHLVPKQVQNHGLEGYGVHFKDEAIKYIIQHYTREAGVRQLERQIGAVCRKVAYNLLKQKQVAEFEKTESSQTESRELKPPKRIVIGKSQVVSYLGPEKYKIGKAEAANEVGYTNGLAWTEVGGDLLGIEVAVVPGKGRLTLTGQLGEVMKESAMAALSYVRSRSTLLGLDREFFYQHDFHIHVPEGAVPKDGPSAGIAIATSLVSAVTRIPVKRTVAMTGEVSLRGKVLPIGGLKQKILAAHRGGIRTVILPKENEKDLKEVPKEVIKDLKIILVDHVDQVLVNALDVKNPKMLFKSLEEKKQKIRAQIEGYVTHH